MKFRRTSATAASRPVLDGAGRTVERSLAEGNDRPHRDRPESPTGIFRVGRGATGGIEGRFARLCGRCYGSCRRNAIDNEPRGCKQFGQMNGRQLQRPRRKEPTKAKQMLRQIAGFSGLWEILAHCEKTRARHTQGQEAQAAPVALASFAHRHDHDCGRRPCKQRRLVVRYGGRPHCGRFQRNDEPLAEETRTCRERWHTYRQGEAVKVPEGPPCASTSHGTRPSQGKAGRSVTRTQRKTLASNSSRPCARSFGGSCGKSQRPPTSRWIWKFGEPFQVLRPAKSEAC